MGTDQQSNSAGGHQSDSEFIDELTQIFRAEQALLKALPFFAKGAVSKELTSTFDLYAAQTGEHISKLKQIFNHLGKSPKNAYPNIQQHILQAEKVISNSELTAAARDLELISAAKKIVQFQSENYRELESKALSLGHGNVADIIESIFNQEKEREAIFIKLEVEHVSSNKGKDEKVQERYRFTFNKSTGH